MKPLVLDANVLIRFLERGGDYVETFSKFDRLLIPAAVDGEYRAGIDATTRPGLRRQTSFDALLESSAVEYVPAGRDISSEYAQVFRQLQEKGTPIPQNAFGLRPRRGCGTLRCARSTITSRTLKRLNSSACSSGCCR